MNEEKISKEADRDLFKKQQDEENKIKGTFLNFHIFTNFAEL